MAAAASVAATAVKSEAVAAETSFMAPVPESETAPIQVVENQTACVTPLLKTHTSATNSHTTQQQPGCQQSTTCPLSHHQPTNAATAAVAGAQAAAFALAASPTAPLAAAAALQPAPPAA